MNFQMNGIHVLCICAMSFVTLHFLGLFEIRLFRPKRKEKVTSIPPVVHCEMGWLKCMHVRVQTILILDLAAMEKGGQRMLFFVLAVDTFPRFTTQTGAIPQIIYHQPWTPLESQLVILHDHRPGQLSQFAN